VRPTERSGRLIGAAERVDQTFPSILHPNEAVIPLSKLRKIPVDLGAADSGGGGGQTVNYAPTYNITTPDADSFRKTQTQTAADGLNAAQRALRKNG
jgi:hypothetical protein